METVKDKEKIPNQVAFPSIPLLCTYYKKLIHTQSRCQSRLIERYEPQLNRLMDEFYFLKNKILHTKRGKKKTLNLRLRKTPLVFRLRLNKFG